MTTQTYLSIKRRATDKTAGLLDWANAVIVQLGALPDTWDSLLEAAEVAFYARCYDLGDFEAEFVPSWAAAVAYVRHYLSNYHGLLAYAAGKPGADEAYRVIKERVNAAVERELKKRYTKSEA